MFAFVAEREEVPMGIWGMTLARQGKNVPASVKRVRMVKMVAAARDGESDV